MNDLKQTINRVKGKMPIKINKKYQIIKFILLYKTIPEKSNIHFKISFININLN